MSKITGIYCFTNLINDKKYIGQSIDVQERISQHKYRYKLENDTGYKSAFHSALRKYGWENFSFSIVEECTIEELDNKEKYWIQKCNTMSPCGYNLTVGGQKNKTDYTKRICPICGKVKSKGAKVCRECSLHPGNHTNHPGNHTKPLLTSFDFSIENVDDVLSTSWEAAAKKMGYRSGNALKKRFKAFGVPTQKEKLFKYYEEQTGKQHPKQSQIKPPKVKKEIRKKCAVYDLSGNLLQTFPSIREASRQMNLHSGRICECCSGKRSKYKDLVWKYVQ